MKKSASVMFSSILLCFVITVFFQNQVKSEINIDHSISTLASSHTNICLSCHLVGDLHEKAGHTDCSQCHDGTPAEGNVEASMCSDCHLTGDPGKCGLVEFHPESCIKCHQECVEEATTTTTTGGVTSHTAI